MVGDTTPQMQVGDTVSRNREPGRLGTVMAIERDRYSSSNDIACVLMAGSTVAIPVPRYRWDCWTVHPAEPDRVASPRA